MLPDKEERSMDSQGKIILVAEDDVSTGSCWHGCSNKHSMKSILRGMDMKRWASCAKGCLMPSLRTGTCRGIESTGRPPMALPPTAGVPWGRWDFRGPLGFEDFCRRGIRDLLQSIDPEN
jgi:hypothetical protein